MSFDYRRRNLETPGLEARAEGDAPAVIKGHASVFNSWYTLYDSPTLQIRERVLPGAFRNAIESGQDVRMLQDHKPSLILGRTRAGTLRLSEDSEGLYFECELPNTTLGRDVAELIRRGDVSQCSFSFTPRPGGETVTTRSVEGGKTIQEIELSDLDVFDTSIVTYPASPSTDVSLRARQHQDQIKQRWLEQRRERLDSLQAAAATK